MDQITINLIYLLIVIIIPFGLAELFPIVDKEKIRKTRPRNKKN